MKLYLTSTAANVLPQVVYSIGNDVRGMKVAFVPTAGNPYKETSWIDEDKEALVACGFEVFTIDIADKTEEDLRGVLKNADIIFVAGGNTFYLLEKIYKSGFDTIIKEFISQNKIYIGSSAGSIILGPDIKFAEVYDDPAIADLDSTKGLNIVNFIPAPHYKTELSNSKYDKVIKKYEKKYEMVPLTDDQFIIVDDEGYRLI